MTEGGCSCDSDVFEPILNRYNSHYDAYEVDYVLWLIQCAEDWRHGRCGYKGNTNGREMKITIYDVMTYLRKI